MATRQPVRRWYALLVAALTTLLVASPIGVRAAHAATVDHYRIELKAWIPQARVDGPLPDPDKLCGVPLSATELASYNGNGHVPYSTSTADDFKARAAYDFDWDGSTIRNGVFQKAVGSTHMSMAILSPVPAQCTATRTTNGTATIDPPSVLDAVPGFALHISAANPFVFAAPTIDSNLYVSFLGPDHINILISTDKFPSHGFAIYKNGVPLATAVEFDASCKTVTGAEGLKTIGAGLSALAPNGGTTSGHINSHDIDTRVLGQSYFGTCGKPQPPSLTYPRYTPPPPAPPTAPTLRVESTTTSSVSLSWTRSANAQGYRIYEGNAVVATVADPTTTATVGALAASSTHTYAVKAFNGAGESARSNAVTATTQASWLYAFAGQTVANADGSPGADLAHARPGQRFTVTVSVRNTGTATWTSGGANPVLLGTADPRDHAGVLSAPGWVSPTRPARLAEASVAPGGTGHFSVPIAAPDVAQPLAPHTTTEGYGIVAEGLTWLTGPGLSVTVTTVPVTGLAVVPGTAQQQWVVAADGGVFGYAGAPFFGSMGGQPLNAPVVGIAATPSGRGYWLVGADGGVFAFGDAPFAGSMAGRPLNRPVVGITGTPSGRGYWLVAADGGVFAFGDAPFLGSMGGQPLNAPVVGIAATPGGHGYWLAAADGGVFAYGDAVFSGNLVGRQLNAPIVGIAGSPDARGYWLAGADGGVFAFGAVPFAGSLAGVGTARPVVGITRTAGGYAVVDRAGQATFFTSGQPVNRTTLYPGERLLPGERLVSGNGRYVLVMQGDGNLVEYDGGTPVWATNTFAANSTFEAQGDGNFVVYAPGHVPAWATGTTQPGSVLVVQDDRNVVVYAPGNHPVWANGRNI